MVCFALLEFTRPQFGLTVNLTCNTALHYFGLLLKSSLACAAWVWPSRHYLNQPQKSSIVWPAPYWFASLASFTDLPYNTFREMSAWIALLVWEEGHAAWRKDPFADKTIPHVNSTPIFKPITLPNPHVSTQASRYSLCGFRNICNDKTMLTNPSSKKRLSPIFSEVGDSKSITCTPGAVRRSPGDCSWTGEDNACPEEGGGFHSVRNARIWGRKKLLTILSPRLALKELSR